LRSILPQCVLSATEILAYRREELSVSSGLEYFSRTFTKGFVYDFSIRRESVMIMLRFVPVGAALARNFVMIFLRERIARGIWNSFHGSWKFLESAIKNGSDGGSNGIWNSTRFLNVCSGVRVSLARNSHLFGLNEMFDDSGALLYISRILPRPPLPFCDSSVISSFLSFGARIRWSCSSFAIEFRINRFWPGSFLRKFFENSTDLSKI